MLRKPLASNLAGKGRIGRAVSRFGSNRRGATAVEFALVALPFFFMVFAIFELAIIFLISITLDNGTANAARAIRTGNTQAAGGGPTSAGALSLEQTICGITPDGTFTNGTPNMTQSPTLNLGWLGGQCRPNDTLFIDVRTLSGFADNSAPPTVVNQQMNTPNFCFYSGKGSDIVLVRAFFKWPLLTPFLSSALSRLGNGMALVSSTSTFKSEPFPGAGGSGSVTC